MPDSAASPALPPGDDILADFEDAYCRVDGVGPLRRPPPDHPFFRHHDQLVRALLLAEPPEAFRRITLSTVARWRETDTADPEWMDFDRAILLLREVAARRRLEPGLPRGPRRSQDTITRARLASHLKALFFDHGQVARVISDLIARGDGPRAITLLTDDPRSLGRPRVETPESAAARRSAKAAIEDLLVSNGSGPRANRFHR